MDPTERQRILQQLGKIASADDLRNNPQVAAMLRDAQGDEVRSQAERLRISTPDLIEQTRHSKAVAHGRKQNEAAPPTQPEPTPPAPSTPERQTDLPRVQLSTNAKCLVVAAFIRDESKSRIDDVAADIRLPSPDAQEIARSLIGNAFLTEAANDGWIELIPERRQEVESLANELIQDAATLSKEDRHFITNLARYGRQDGARINLAGGNGGLTMQDHEICNAIVVLRRRSLLKAPIAFEGLKTLWAELDTLGWLYVRLRDFLSEVADAKRREWISGIVLKHTEEMVAVDLAENAKPYSDGFKIDRNKYLVPFGLSETDFTDALRSISKSLAKGCPVAYNRESIDFNRDLMDLAKVIRERGEKMPPKASASPVSNATEREVEVDGERFKLTENEQRYLLALYIAPGQQHVDCDAEGEQLRIREIKQIRGRFMQIGFAGAISFGGLQLFPKGKKAAKQAAEPLQLPQTPTAMPDTFSGLERDILITLLGRERGLRYNDFLFELPTQPKDHELKQFYKVLYRLRKTGLVDFGGKEPIPKIEWQGLVFGLQPKGIEFAKQFKTEQEQAEKINPNSFRLMGDASALRSEADAQSTGKYIVVDGVGTLGNGNFLHPQGTIVDPSEDGFPPEQITDLLQRNVLRPATAAEVAAFDHEYLKSPEQVAWQIRALNDYRRSLDAKVSKNQLPSLNAILCIELMNELNQLQAKIYAAEFDKSGAPIEHSEASIKRWHVERNRRLQGLNVPAKLLKGAIRKVADPLMRSAANFGLSTTPLQNYVDGFPPASDPRFFPAEGFLKDLRWRLEAQEEKELLPMSDFRIDKSKPASDPSKASRVGPPGPQPIVSPEAASLEQNAVEQEMLERLVIGCYETKTNLFNCGEAARLANLSEGEASPLWIKLHHMGIIRIRAEYRAEKTDIGEAESNAMKAKRNEKRKEVVDAKAGGDTEWGGWLLRIVKEGRNTPVGKLAYALLLLGTAAAFIALIFRFDLKYAFFSMVAIVPLAGVVLALSWAKEHGKKDARPIYLFFIVVCLLAFTVVVALSISITFFGVPEAGARRIFGP